MSNTGNTFPVTGENIDRAGLTAWTNPGNIVSDNTTDATCNATGSDYLVARQFGFSIPAGSTIQGVLVRVEASEHSTGTEPLLAQLQDASGALIGSSKSTSNQGSISGTAKAVYTYGSTSDVWGATLDSTIVNDVDFGVRLWFTTAHDVRIDYVTLAVEYLAPRSGSLSQTLADVTKSFIGTVRVAGSASKTLDAISLSAAGTVSAAGVNGSLSKTLDNLTRSIAGTVRVSGIASKTLDDLTRALAGTVRVAGVAAPTLGDISGTLAGTVKVSGSFGQTLEDVTKSLVGTIRVAGILSYDLEDIALLANNAGASAGGGPVKPVQAANPCKSV